MTSKVVLTPIVHLVDDDISVGTALRRALAAEGYETACHNGAVSFMAACDPDRPGCAVFDLRMPGMDGLELQAQLASRGIFLPVIFLSGQGDVASSVRAMKEGAVDFLEKPVSTQTLVAAIERALALDLRRRVAADDDRHYEALHSRLTPRETEVLDGIVSGRLNKQIAADLGIAEKTVKVHRQRVMQKLEVRTLAELVTFVVSHSGNGATDDG